MLRVPLGYVTSFLYSDWALPNKLMGFLDRLSSAIKSLRFPAPAPPNLVSVFPTWADFDQAVNQLLIGFKGTGRDYASAVGDLTMSSLMMAAVTAVGNSASEAELQVREQQGNEEVIVDDHPLGDYR